MSSKISGLVYEYPFNIPLEKVSFEKESGFPRVPGKILIIESINYSAAISPPLITKSPNETSSSTYLSINR